MGVTGLLWLFATYSYALFYASNLISQGSELLLLVPSIAGLVGGIVLPVLGAVPDGAIILFSGLGSIDEAQEKLSVGVGALAGSTIMLLTTTFALSIFGGRVDVDAGGMPKYTSKPKLSHKTNLVNEFVATGVATSKAVKKGGVVMALTTVPFFLIQIPAGFIHAPSEEVSEGEHWWALAGLIICLIGLVAYMKLQLQISQEGQDQEKRVAAVKKLLQEKKVSLSGALGAAILDSETALLASTLSLDDNEKEELSEYKKMEIQLTSSQTSGQSQQQLPPKVSCYLKEVLSDAFLGYDTHRKGRLKRREVFTFFRDFHETIKEKEMNSLFEKFDTDHSGALSLDEFIGMAHRFIVERERSEQQSANNHASISEEERVNGEKNIWEDGDDEEEEVPEEFTDLPPDQQQRAIKKRAFSMLLIGTIIVVFFSDPMVDVMQEIAYRVGLPPFYVAFLLAPLASNSSEVYASYYYAAKKTRKSISVSLSALEGAASMNNTFCLSIFMGLIFFRGLASEYSAETIAILVVEFIMAAVVQMDILTTAHGVVIVMIFPLSIALVAVLHSLGFD